MIFTPRAKHWAVELRFDRPLTQREQRYIRGMLYGVAENEVGRDGAKITHWPNKWPDEHDDALIRTVVRRIGAPARVRAAPFGRDCLVGRCEASTGAARCSIGDVAACDPVFFDLDWQTIDPLATENP